MGRIGVEFCDQLVECFGDARWVGLVEGDGDRVVLVVDCAAEVQLVAGDRPVFVGVGEVGV